MQTNLRQIKKTQFLAVFFCLKYLLNMERVMGVEPTRPAWKAGILPLNYTRTVIDVKVLYIVYFALSNDFRLVLIIVWGRLYLI